MEAFTAWIEDPKNKVHSLDFPKALEKIKQLKICNLHFVADFDMTITKYWDDGLQKRSMSSHGALENWSGLSQEVKTNLRQLYLKYYPVEVSTTITDAEKRKAMEAWWDGAHVSIVESRITKKDIRQIVKEARFIFRPFLPELIESLRNLGVPLLVFSAGLGDIIEEVFRVEGICDVEIVSNKMKFSNDVCIGFEDPLIHVLNKNEAAIHGAHADKIVSRSSVVLLGDSIGDLKMADGMQHDFKLSVGLLNHDIEDRKEKYLEAFDIVLTDDTSLEFFTRLLEVVAA